MFNFLTYLKIALALITYMTVSKEGNVMEINGVCASDACRTAANRILTTMNRGVKPCDNFYQFVCGNFMRVGKNLRKLKGSFNRFGTLSEIVKYRIKSILQEKPKDNEPRSYRTLKRLFQLCMDEKKMDLRGASPGLAVLEKLGGWPVLDSWNQQQWNFEETESRARQLGVVGNSLIMLNIKVSPTDSTKAILEVNQPSLPIARHYFLQGQENPMVKQYFKYMVDMALLYSPKINRTSAEKHMRNVLELQIKIAEIIVPDEERLELDKKNVTLKELDDDRNKLLDWRKLFERMASPIKLTDDQMIVFYEPEVITKIATLIKKYSAEVIADHVMWKFAIHMSSFLTTAMRNRNRHFKRVLQGTTKNPRWVECVNEVAGMDVALSSIYVQKFVHKSFRSQAVDLTNRLRAEMDKVIREGKWMEEVTKKKAQEKSAKILQIVAYPEEVTDINMVEAHYKELHLSEEHYLDAQMGWHVWLAKEECKPLNVKTDRRHWSSFTRSTRVDASYNIYMNAIDVPAGILQEPFFSTSTPNYMNYGSVGVIIGHEITHGFDDQGREFNGEGELQNWWDERSLQRFKKKNQCFINQYNGFVESETKMNVNGVLTQAENIADNGGVQMAYRAYRKLADQLKKPEPALPDLEEFNNNQMFMISFANTCCTLKPLESMRHYMLTDTHTPSEWRVNGALMNLPEFAKEFNCGDRTTMNPVKRCKIW